MKTPDNSPNFPFKGKFTRIDIYGPESGRPDMYKQDKFRVLDSKPGKIFRTISGLGAHTEGQKLSERDYEIVKDKIATLKKIFLSLGAHGINIPDIDFFVSEDLEGIPCVFAMIDKIEGESLSKMLSSPESVKAQEMLKDLVLKWVKYWETSYRNNDAYMIDIYKPGDYVYGRKTGDEEDKLYLVDIDANYFFNPIVDESGLKWRERHGEDNFFLRLELIVSMILYCEKKFGMSFDEVRSYLNKMLVNEKHFWYCRALSMLEDPEQH